ncbi:MAG: site-specific DNA-methyltransferase [Betaproteobacteria bacterium]|nr:site-specific DNA-methyltransferase [Betaproteobacteria bacterium]
MPTLDWLHKHQALRAAGRVPYRLLNAESVYGEANADNWLIQGDNLEALKALLPFHGGRVKCIYIDPPYNTRSAFEHYDDNLEHSQWLSMMYPRLELLRELLAEDGSIWVSIDDNEAHYLKVAMDEVFGRRNFIANVVWQKKYAVKSDSEFLSESHDHILLYAKSRERVALYRLPRTEQQDSRYSNPDNDPRGPWTSGPLQRNEARDYAIYPIASSTGKEHWPPKGTSWRFTTERMAALIADHRIWFGASGNNVPRLKRFLAEVANSVPATTWWSYSDAGHNDEARREAKLIHEANDLFGTPKPERVAQRILSLATRPDDLVLDSFLGSGTTAAVAHKMGRRYIGIEMGDHARSHCLPRLQKVVEGEQGGISQAVGWKGGGGFRFFTLGQPVFLADGRINPEIRFASLASWVWYQEMRRPLVPREGLEPSPLLGVGDGTAIALLYNGILGDRRPQGGNVLTSAILARLKGLLPAHDGPWLVFGECSRLSEQRLANERVRFKQIPYAIRAG